ncbi:spermidine synthase [uncultured Adlercreutzia sp.]|uniref:spermidine synthase n=1 Tax=uncultured Adlercreutzia sp. TaxID=875803 RepID=UPI0026F38490|nr:fused MFS/spermidine synthase [uncultured Adlercreutzia sp.]
MTLGLWDKLRGRGGREVFPTMFGEAAVYAMAAADGSLVRMLNVGGVLQSATYLDERWAVCPFAYLRSFNHMFEAAELAVRRVLMIGGAGFAYPKQLLTEHPGVKLDVVEIDPAMVAIARSHFFLDRLEAQLAAEGRADDLCIFTEDGAAFLMRSREAYDVIIIDAFVGRDAVPFFVSDEGIAAAKARLTPGGLLMANCVAEFTGDAMYRLFSQVERLRDHFAEVYVIDASDEEFGGADNYLLIATDTPYPFTGVIPYGD